ncbi:hypothetical protein RB195_016033 [Necator americanus]|uniref:Uncharacterized protein n=1 Tax=Necator americanus TaxID=51031 RepID=A0ABR1E7F3_NECAM
MVWKTKIWKSNPTLLPIYAQIRKISADIAAIKFQKMIVVLCILGVILMNEVEAYTEDLSIIPLLSCANILCAPGYKCVMLVPDDCVGCRAFPRCVQQECNTSCVLPCPVFSTCVLVSTPTDCCPKAACRPRQIITISPPTDETIRFTIEPPMVTGIVKPGDPVEEIP